jgi:hypothetical protein
MKKILITSGFAIALMYSAIAQNQVPQVSNVQFSNQAGLVTVNYDVFEPEGETMNVSLMASEDNGKTFTIKATVATGDIGSSVTTGTGKSISWIISIDAPTANPDELVYRIVADDGLRPDISAIIAGLKKENILTNFAGVYGNNHPASQQHYDETRAYIYDFYTKLGLVAERDSFTTPQRNGVNIIGNKLGLTNPATKILMTGHYDTVEPTPGADDNNMSVAIIMAAAKLLKDYQFENTIVFANWDLEEIGLLGAYYYAVSLRRNGVQSVLNFDGVTIYKEEPNSQQVPTGFDVLFPDAYAKAEADSFRGNFITLIADAKSAALNQKTVEYANEYVQDLKYIDLTCPDPSCVIATDLRRSDHAPFWDVGVPSVFFTSTTEFRSDCYHQPCDTVYNIDFSTKVIKLATSVLIDEAQPIHAGIGQTQATTSIKTLDAETWFINPPFPNPSTVHTFFEVGVGETSNVSVKIYDISGRLVATPYEGKLSKGKHILSWNQYGDVASGLYTAIVQINNNMQEQYKIQVNQQSGLYKHGH